VRGVLAALPKRPNWEVHRFSGVFERRKVTGYEGFEPLSVFTELGVVPRGSQDWSYKALGQSLSGYLLVEPGDLVFNKLRTWQGALGLSAYRGIVSPAYFVFRARVRIDPRYYHYLLRSSAWVQELKRLSKWMPPNQNDISWNDLKRMQVLVPPLAEQRAIADFLDRETARIDAIIVKKRRLAEVLRARFLEKARGLLTEGLQVKDPLDVRETESASAGSRKVVRLAWDFAFGSGTTPPAGDERYYGPGVPWLITGDLTDWEVPSVPRSVTQEALASYSALKIHPAGSLVIAMYGATVGRLGLVGFEFVTNQACCVLHSGTSLDVQFVFYWLLGHREALLLRGVGAGQPNISQEMIRSIRIAAPSRNEQMRLVKELNTYRDKTETSIDRLTRQIALLAEHRQALITAAVTGQMDISSAA